LILIYYDQSKITDMKPLVKNMLAGSVAVILFSIAVAQQPAYSDISINAMSLAAAGPSKKIPATTSTINQANHAPVNITTSNDVLKCSIAIDNVSGANAYGAKLIVVLPAEATVPAGGLPPNATVMSQRVASGGGPGYIEFDLSIIYPGRPVTVEFTFNKSPHANKLSAFVICAVPDANPLNNYKEATY
jgi:hypothetical protein